jgi:NhaP-type Na+/H+ or K+/H+ antiporter
VTHLQWMAAAGGLFLLMALSSALVRRLPLTTAMIYLGIGVAVGPAGLGALAIDLDGPTPWFLQLTEFAVIASLFVGGLKLRLPFTEPAWQAPWRLAGPGMLLTMAGVAVLLHLVGGWTWPVAMTAAAILAPTDPVLAGAVTVSEADDRDRMRYALSGEAGLNDGTAFPFVVFGLLWLQADHLGAWVGPWALSRLLWAVPAGLTVGYVLGRGVGRLGIQLRHWQRDLRAPSDLLGLALILLSYTAAEGLHAWGFLAAFAAGVGMRHAERGVVREDPHPDHDEGDPDVAHPPAEDVVPDQPSEHDLAHPAVAAGVVVGETLTFGDTLERLLEVVLVVLVGVLLASHADAFGLLVAVVLIVVVRPIAVRLALIGAPTSAAQGRLIGWFGIRGIGSLYYLAYALEHGLGGPAAYAVSNIVVTTVATSIVAHGVSAHFLLPGARSRTAS